jgi:hypothetical protein
VLHRAGFRNVLRPDGRVRRRTVVGMLLGGCLQHLWPLDRVHFFFFFFFARARWELDQLGLAVAQLAVALLTELGADLRVAVDDSVFRRRDLIAMPARIARHGRGNLILHLPQGPVRLTARGGRLAVDGRADVDRRPCTGRRHQRRGQHVRRRRAHPPPHDRDNPRDARLGHRPRGPALPLLAPGVTRMPRGCPRCERA